MTFIPSLTFTELWVVSMEHLQRVWLASRERLPLRTPGSVPLFGGLACALIVETSFPRLYTNLMTVPKLTLTEMRGFHGAFATGVASHQGALTLPDTWFRPPFWDLLMLQRWDQIPRTCHVFTRLFTSNTPWYFLDFAFSQFYNGKFWCSQTLRINRSRP